MRVLLERIGFFLLGILILLAPPAGLFWLATVFADCGYIAMILAVPVFIVLGLLVKEGSGPAGLEIIAAAISRPKPPLAVAPGVVYLRPFDTDGDSAYPFQGGSRRTLGRSARSAAGRDEGDVASEHVTLAAHLYFSIFRGSGPRGYIGSNVWGLGYEQLLTFAVGRVGSLISFENEDERTELLRWLARMPTAREKWMLSIDELLGVASLVVIRPGDSPGIGWEMRRVRACCDPKRVLLFFPVNALLGREDDYPEVKAAAEHALGCVLPDTLPRHVCFVGFDAQWVAAPEDRRGRLPIAWYGGAVTAESMRHALRARGLPHRSRSPLPALLIMPLNLGLCIAMLLLIAYTAAWLVIRTVLSWFR